MQRISWLQFILLPITIAIMFTTWFEPWIQWLVHTTGVDRASAVPSPLIMIAVILTSASTTRYALSRAPYQRRITLVGGLVTLVVVIWLINLDTFPAVYVHNLLDWQNSIAPELFVLLALGVLWWRGILIGRSRALIDENVERTFFNGILALVGLAFVNNLTQYVAALDMLAAVLLFFATALSALIIINVERTRLQQVESASWKRQRHWLGTVAAVVSAILLSGVVLAGVFSPDALRQILAALGPAFSTLGNVLIEILKPAFTFLFWLITPLVPLLESVLRALLQGIIGLFSILHNLGAQVNALKVQQQIQSFLDSPQFATLARGSSVVVILIIFALIAIWALRRSGLAARKNLDETRESIASRALLLNQLRNLFARRQARAAARSPYLTLAGDDPRMVVRRVYQAMLRWAADRVGARTPSQTPSAYADRIARAVPGQRDNLQTLTTLYLRARYALDPIGPDEARAAQSALVHLQESPVIQSPLAEE